LTPALFIRQIVAELRKVIWPTRNELVTYTTVALVFVVIMTAIVTSLDYGFTKLMFVLFG
jgi:preprotein translocase subunit SecE